MKAFKLCFVVAHLRGRLFMMKQQDAFKVAIKSILTCHDSQNADLLEKWGIKGEIFFNKKMMTTWLSMGGIKTTVELISPGAERTGQKGQTITVWSHELKNTVLISTYSYNYTKKKKNLLP